MKTRFFIIALASFFIGFVGCKDQPLGLGPDPLTNCTLPIAPKIVSVYPNTVVGYGIRVDWTNIDSSYFYRVVLEYSNGCSSTGWTEHRGESSMLMTGFDEGRPVRVIVIGYVDPKCWGEDECECETAAAVKEF